MDFAAAASSLDRRIVPGHSIGHYVLGQDVAGLVASLGPLYGGADLPNDSLTGYYWPLKRVGAVASRRTHKIVALAVSLDDTYATDGGIGAGVRLDAVRRALGPEDAVDPAQSGDMLVYDTLGIAFVVGYAGALEGRVSAVFVLLRGHAHEIFPL
ncbi:MAG TPA: hypothetical protein VGX75_11510 [bacterium]|nr:hypothetical protein [bacterium]